MWRPEALSAVAVAASSCLAFGLVYLGGLLYVRGLGALAGEWRRGRALHVGAMLELAGVASLLVALAVSGRPAAASAGRISALAGDVLGLVGHILGLVLASFMLFRRLGEPLLRASGVLHLSAVAPSPPLSLLSLLLGAVLGLDLTWLALLMSYVGLRRVATGTCGGAPGWKPRPRGLPLACPAAKPACCRPQAT